MATLLYSRSTRGTTNELIEETYLFSFASKFLLATLENI